MLCYKHILCFGGLRKRHWDPTVLVCVSVLSTRRQLTCVGWREMRERDVTLPTVTGGHDWPVEFSRSSPVVCVCVFLCVCFFLVVWGVGSWDKAALCLVNLSHKFQLAGGYATTTEMYTCGTCCCCVWPRPHIHSNRRRRQPEAFILTPLVPPPPTHTHTHTHTHRHTNTDTPTARLNVARITRERWVVLRGGGRLLLPSSPPSLNCHGIDSQAYTRDLVSSSSGGDKRFWGDDGAMRERRVVPFVTTVSVLVIYGSGESGWVNLKNVCGLVCDMLSGSLLTKQAVGAAVWILCWYIYIHR